jgi:nitroreductase
VNGKPFLDVVTGRKSVRSFRPDPVPRELVEEIVRIGTMAPSNCNQQLWSVVAVEDPAVRERIVAEAAGNTLLLRVPMVLVVTYDGWNYKEAMQGASLLVGHMLLAAESMGLSALPMNSYGGDSGVRRVLGIPESEAICCFVSLGWPDERSQALPPVPRRPVSEVLHWNRFDARGRAPYVYDPEAWTAETLAGHHRHYCRKTTPGKEMDIMSARERTLTRAALAACEGPFVDLLSYDGSWLREYPEPPSTVDLTVETAAYSAAAGAAAGEENPARAARHEVLDPSAKHLPIRDAGTAALLFKAERIPSTLRRALFAQTRESLREGGQFVVVSRKRNPVLSLFFLTVRVLFGKDPRKTGIFAFFGPYRPVAVGDVVADLRAAGFRDVTWTGHFPLPAFCDRLYQMLLQYRASEGSSYLHRKERSTMGTRLLDRLLNLQGAARFGFLGSVVVIRCRR